MLAALLLLAAADPLLLRHAPLLQRRANAAGTESDVPLLMYVEKLKDKAGALYLQYSVIFSNEDGGTSTRALMARWGRTTDIEHVYRVWLDADGRRIKALIQTKNHVDVPFKGPFQGDRPILRVITNNNMLGPGKRGQPVTDLEPHLVDLSGASREQVMDERPEMYRQAAEELAREDKLKLMGDPRHYLYLEAEIANGKSSRIAARVRLRDGPKWYSSHVGRAAWAIERSGFVRTTIALPAGTTAADVVEVGFDCLGDDGECEIRQVTKGFFLDAGYRPGASFLHRRLDWRLTPGEMMTWTLTSK
ncbi:MAG: hypothetical protein JNN08_05680 [Bryobacterales bacterium]|nr:hypothetical protein [Bryobacterales bacterium]